MRRVLVLAVLLIVPTVLARPLGVEGRIESAQPLEVEGRVTMRVHAGALDLTAAALAGAELGLSGQSGDGRRVTYPSAGIQNAWDTRGTATVERVRVGDGSLRDLRCQEECMVVLFVLDGRTGVLALDGEWRGPLPWLQRPIAYCGWTMCDRGPDDFNVPYPPGALHWPDEPAVATGEGLLALFLRNATATWASAEGNVTLDASSHRRAVDPAHATFEGRDRFVLVELAGARLAAGQGRYSLVGEEAHLRVLGSVASPRATGEAQVDGNRSRFVDEAIDVRGGITLDLHGRGERLHVAPSLSPDATVAGTFTAEATSARLGARSWSAPPEVRSHVAAAGTAAALLVTLVLLAPRLLLPLYSRVAPDRLLSSPNRARLYEAIQARPGVTLAELSRSMGLARVVVQHHQRMLEAHRLIAPRSVGRSRKWFAAGAVPRAEALDAHLSLSDPTRRLVAAFVAARGGATQKEVVEATGLSQRLVSYHLHKLQEAGLVGTEGLLPKRYVPRQLLPAVLRAVLG